jgi:hypothetical protein
MASEAEQHAGASPGVQRQALLIVLHELGQVKQRGDYVLWDRRRRQRGLQAAHECFLHALIQLSPARHKAGWEQVARHGRLHLCIITLCQKTHVALMIQGLIAKFRFKGYTPSTQNNLTSEVSSAPMSVLSSNRKDTSHDNTSQKTKKVTMQQPLDNSQPSLLKSLDSKP